MKILHLMGPLRPSGMERMFLSAAPHFASSGVDVVIVGQGSENPFAADLERSGYTVRTIAPLRSARGLRQWLRVLREERPDIVHIQTEGAFLFSVLGVRWAAPRTPIVRTVHGMFMPRGRAYWSRVVQGAIVDRFVAHFVAVSPDVQENERRFRREAILILNWVDERFFDLRRQRARLGRERPNRASVVIVGNSSQIKNHAVALRALSKVSLDLYFHGDESYATQEEIGLLDRLAAAGRLRYRGVGDPGQSLVGCTYFLLPSKHEGMSIALAEALVVGAPAIVSNVPGVQWSESFPGVQLINNEPAVWERALAGLDQSVSDEPSQSEAGREPLAELLPLDLSARRGAGELIQLYAGIV